MEQFEIRVPDEVLDDLNQRLGRTRLPDLPATPVGGEWSLGTSRSYLRDLIAHWRSDFDWRAVESRLNSYPHHRAWVDGVPIHFVHCRGKGPQPIPLILSHGWPSTFAEMLPLVDRLTEPDPRDPGSPTFDLVIPSLPGFAFSSPYTEIGPRRIHQLWAALMTELGYERFAAAGSDLGARVTSRLGWHFPERVIGIHLSSVDIEWPDPLPDDLSDDERAYVAGVERWEREEGGYAAIQATKPQTLAYGLADSPVGLAAWIVEKFRSWSDCAGDISSAFSFDELLTTITLYWATNTINSANRGYFQARHDPDPLRLAPGTRVETPTGIAMFPGETELQVPRSFAERCYNLVRWSDMPRGGHFPALEEPDLLAEDIRGFFAALVERATDDTQPRLS